MQVLNLSFSEDLNHRVFDHIVDDTILIYPTRAAAQQARLEYEARWQLERLQFTSMEDFKASLILPEKPIPEDDKRLLALYQVLSQEDRDYFHLYGYQDLVSWGAEFFSFFGELWEAEIPFDELNSWQDNPELALRDWQEKNIQRLVEIGTRYRQFIEERGFEDLIFHSGALAAEIPFKDWRIICVNQYYYSKLEQTLLSECERAGNGLILVYQGVEGIANSFKHRSLNLEAAWESLAAKPKIQIVEAENERQAALSFLALESGDKPLSIIDSSFILKSYSAYFDPQKLKLQSSLPISETSWYRTQRIMLEILQEMELNKGLIPIRLILKYFGSLSAVMPFVPDWKEQDFIAFRYELHHQIKVQTIYLDIDINRQFDQPDSRIYQFCSALNSILKQILSIQNLNKLLLLLDGALNPKHFSSEEELNNSDLLARTWEAMANFLAIEKLGFVQDWTKVFIKPALNIFQLWLDQLKSLRLKRTFNETKQPVWEISNLLDARNRVFKRLAVFNMVEGILPSSPSAIWLLNEHQRQKLGMKCYEDIRDWERYYFFRLLFCSREATLYCYLDKKNAIDHSSFISELGVLLAENPPFLRKCKVHENELLKAWREQAEQDLLSLPPDIYLADAKDASFFCIPSLPIQDFKGSKIPFSSYNLQLFVSNPFAWYLRGLRAIEKLQIPRRELISPILFGLLLHDYFGKVLAQDDGIRNSYTRLDEIFNDTELLSHTLKEIIDSDAYRYKIPRNYNYSYLNYIVSERLAISLQEFYQLYLKKRIKDGAFTLIPEDTLKGNLEKTLLIHKYADRDYQIVLRGRADLRIETPQKHYIVDFKTGGAYNEQLIFYEWLYYLLDDPELAEEVESSFWKILEMEIAGESSNAKKRDGYLESIVNALTENFSAGYGMARTVQDRANYQEISRSDLYKRGGEND
ncbi:MAG: PD-(D/E)XK nuclease family protein [Candidatus Cloacimonetes bacterium]|nr:PD-(D/E)XK nuclease family protein [Candidatus Cloacimonadota bacterium]